MDRRIPDPPPMLLMMMMKIGRDDEKRKEDGDGGKQNGMGKRKKEEEEGLLLPILLFSFAAFAAEGRGKSFVACLCFAGGMEQHPSVQEKRISVEAVFAEEVFIPAGSEQTS